MNRAETFNEFMSRYEQTKLLSLVSEDTREIVKLALEAAFYAGIASEVERQLCLAE